MEFPQSYVGKLFQIICHKYKLRGDYKYLMFIKLSPPPKKKKEKENVKKERES